MLTPAIVRMEWSPTGGFEDRASFNVINRRLPVPSYTVNETDDGHVTIATDDVTVQYRLNSGRFATDNLRVVLHAAGVEGVEWVPGTPETGNLGGTVRTLDGVSGATPLRPGLVSRDGWVLFDDSKTLLFASGEDWLTPVARGEDEAQDWYFLGHGRNYARALREFTQLAGTIPLPPRWTLGSWWSRYWEYSESELRDIVAQFERHDVPLDVMVIDMDWHLEGWTGYTWNRELFPDPAGFLAWLREKGLKVTLNLHPHDGVGRHEEAFAAMAEAMGLDPEVVDRVPFDVTSRQYMEAYFRILHHPQERMGVDFWWMDWQQGTGSALEGLDPLFWLNHLHWVDMERNEERADRRPLIFSRWANVGNMRYQIGFSGDTFCNWESLAFQPYFTATAGNVGYPYWSHDIGGHQHGPVEGELYARWIQFAVFNPFLRTHATKNPRAERRIWAFEPEIFRAAREAFHLRYALIPYIYTANRRTYDTAEPLVRPIYWEWPELEESYEADGLYLFGDQFLVAPAVEPRSPASHCTLIDTWLPPGTWRHWHTGEVFDRQARLMVPLEQIPAFVRDGAIVPLAPKMSRSDERPLDHLMLEVFPGEQGRYELYEDDGDSRDFERPEGQARTVIEMKREGPRVRLKVGARQGAYAGAPALRSWHVRWRDVMPPVAVKLAGAPVERVPVQPAMATERAAWWYDAREATCHVMLQAGAVGDARELELTFESAEVEVRNGLRGRLALIRDLHGRLAASGAKLDGLSMFVQELAGLDPMTVHADVMGEMADDMRASRVGWCTEIVKSEAPDDLKLEAVLRLLGLSVRFDVAHAAELGTMASVQADLLEPLDGLLARVSLKAPEGWQLVEASSGDASPIGFEPWTWEGRMQAPASPQLAVVRGQLVVESPAGELAIPLATTLYPSIGAWWVCGPFEHPFSEGMSRVHPPEWEQLMAAQYPGKEGQTASWKRVERDMAGMNDIAGELLVDLNEVFGEPLEDACAYAMCYIRVPDARDAQLAIGSDDGVAAWVNDVQVHSNPRGRAYSSREDIVPITLQAGLNKVLLKITQGSKGWMFCAHLEHRDGRAMDDAMILLEPAAEADVVP